MEKRRRARINNCLNELKSLILDAMKKDVSYSIFAKHIFIHKILFFYFHQIWDAKLCQLPGLSSVFSNGDSTLWTFGTTDSVEFLRFSK